MKFNKSQQNLLDHAKRVGYVAIEQNSKRFQAAADQLVATGLMRHESSTTKHDTFSLTEKGRQLVFGYKN